MNYEFIPPGGGTGESFPVIGGFAGSAAATELRGLGSSTARKTAEEAEKCRLIGFGCVPVSKGKIGSRYFRDREG